MIRACHIAVAFAACVMPFEAGAKRFDASYGHRLIDQAITLLPESTKDESSLPRAIEALIRTGRCIDAMALARDYKPEPMFISRIVDAAKASQQVPCVIHFSRLWVGLARTLNPHRQPFELNQAGAYLRFAGKEGEGFALIKEAEATISEKPLTRTSLLWFFRMQALRIYKGSGIFKSELDRTADELLAAMPSPERPQILPPTAGDIAGLLHESGDQQRADTLSAAECVSYPEKRVSCGRGGSYIDHDLQKLSDQLANGSLEQQIAARGMLYRNGAVDRIIPAFSRMLALERGDRLRAFGQLIFYAGILERQGNFESSLAGANEALVIRPEKPSTPSDLNRWHYGTRNLIRILTKAGEHSSVERLVRKAKPTSDERDAYLVEIGSGYAQRGDEEAARAVIDRIDDSNTRRAAWFAIGVGVPHVPVDLRLLALRKGEAIPYIEKNSTQMPIGGPPGTINCGELGGGAMIAGEGASAADILRFAEFSRERASTGSKSCAYRRFLLSAVEQLDNIDQARLIGRELLRSTTQPCSLVRCDDYRVLWVLIRLGLFEEAETLVNLFPRNERVYPMLRLGIGLVVPEPDQIQY